MILLLAAAVTATPVNCDLAVTTLDIEHCQTIEADDQEKKMEAAYIEALNKLQDPEQLKEKQAFVAAQDAWLKYRKSYCSAVYESIGGGSVRGAMYAGCMGGHARDRMFELQGYADGQP